MSNFISLIIGALLAISGGAVIEWLKLRMEKRQELKFLKISFVDELHEICSIIEKLSETWERSSMVHKAYIDELSDNMSAFGHHRNRIFLFKKTTVRRELITFYKKLKEAIKDCEGKVGSLAETPEAKSEQEAVKNKFCTLKTEAETLEGKL